MGEVMEKGLEWCGGQVIKRGLDRCMSGEVMERAWVM